MMKYKREIELIINILKSAIASNDNDAIGSLKMNVQYATESLRKLENNIKDDERSRTLYA